MKNTNKIYKDMQGSLIKRFLFLVLVGLIIIYIAYITDNLIITI